MTFANLAQCLFQKIETKYQKWEPRFFILNCPKISRHSILLSIGTILLTHGHNNGAGAMMHLHEPQLFYVCVRNIAAPNASK